jgi:predicted ATPase
MLWGALVVWVPLLITLRVENFGPFEEARVEIKPLTIFIGRNSAGKSLLLYLAWALSSATPAFEEVESGWEDYMKVVEAIVEKVERGESPREEIVEAARLFYRGVFARAVEAGLEERLKHTFGVELRELVKQGKERATIELQAECGRFKATISEALRVEELDICLDRVLETLQVERSARDKHIRVRYADKEEEIAIYGVEDPGEFITRLVAYSTALAFHTLLLSTREFSLLLPDSRAGIARALLKPYTTVSMPLGVDAEYRDLYFRLAEWLYKYRDILEDLRPLLEELGVTPRPVLRAGVYEVEVCSWTGRCAPISMAPSGVREVLSVALALVYPKHINVFVEEPEAHLHPRALRHLAGLIARAVNGGKNVLITTHSDYLIGYINNLIAASRLPRDRLEELGYREDEVLKPEKVAAYLIKPVGDKAVVEPIEIAEDGISEEEFSKIAEEILGERSRIYAQV